VVSKREIKNLRDKVEAAFYEAEPAAAGAKKKLKARLNLIADRSEAEEKEVSQEELEEIKADLQEYCQKLVKKQS